MRHYSYQTLFLIPLLFGVSPSANAPVIDPSQRLAAVIRLLKPPPRSPENYLPSDGDAKRTLTADEKAAIQRNSAFRQEIKQFTAATPSLTPEVAAERWVALVNSLFELQPNQGNLLSTGYPRGGREAEERPVVFLDLVACLPPPASWPEIHAEILRRPIPVIQDVPRAARDQQWLKRLRERMLRLFVQKLTDNEDGVFSEWNALRQDYFTMAQERNPFRCAFWEFSPIGDRLIEQTRNPQRAIALLEGQIAAYVLEKKIASSSPDSGIALMDTHRITFPDTPGLTELPETGALIRRLLLSREFDIDVSRSNAVERRTQRIARENLRLLPNKPSVWELTYDLSDDAMTLYKGLTRRFSDKKTAAETKDARGYYVANLIVRGQIEAAVSRVVRERQTGSLFDGGVSNAIEESGHRKEWYAFLHQLVRRWPEAPVWSELIQLNSTMGRGSETLSFARASAARKNLSPVQRQAAMKIWADAALASDRIDEGVSALRQSVRIARQSIIRPTPTETQYLNWRETLFTQGERFVQLGAALNRPEWREEGLRIAANGARSKEGSIEFIQPYIALLTESGKSEEAEKALLDAVLTEAKKGDHTQYPVQQLIQKYLFQLIGLYDAQHRWADVLTILTRTPLWESGDLRDLLTTDAGKTTVGMAAAHALAAKGRTSEAIAITRALLNVKQSDTAFALYLQLVGAEAAISFLDELALRDRFEERPLIWKAVALFRLKRYADAEKTARAAIAIDPSDGDAPHGDRMRAYAVLSEISQAQGDAKEATFLRNVVRAIRLSEQADDLAEAGLTSRAIRLYTDSLTFFADAYCIQSRLAVKLAGMGRLAEAEVHLRKAYELMPDSFGRMESHCFGCEGAFSSPQNAKIAEQVLTRLAVERPDKPQIFYLLGYIQEQQGQYVKALPNFKRAVELDPDYINAWIGLSHLRTEITLIPEDRKEITRNLTRLSPRIARNLSSPADGEKNRLPFAERYQSAQEWSKFRNRPQPPSLPLFPLPASAAALKNAPPAYLPEEDAIQTATDMLRGDPAVRQVVETLNYFSIFFAQPRPIR